MFTYTVNGKIKRVPRKKVIGCELVFIQAPNKKAIEAAVEVVEKGTISAIHFYEIEMGEKRTFIAGNVKFRGTPCEVVKLAGISHLKIVINQKVSLFIMITLGACTPMEYAEKTSR